MASGSCSRAARAGRHDEAPSGGRGRLWRRGLLIAGVAAVALTAAACGGGSSGGSTASAGSAGTPADGTNASDGSKPVLTIGLPAGPVSLDPSKDSATFTIVRALTNEPITHQKPDGSIGPALATSWKYIGEGNKHFRFTLRPNVKFSDGEPVTAQAVKQWLEYFSKSTGVFVSALGPIDSISTTGARTVDIRLKVGNPTVPTVLSERFNWGFVSSPKAVASPGKMGTETFGAGPYAIDPAQTVTDQQYTLVPNKYYDDPSAVRWSKVVVKVIPEPASLVQAMQAGQLDAAWGEISTASAAKSAGLTVLEAPAGWAGLLLSDHEGKVAKALTDVRVRQALNYAIDRKAIATALGGDYKLETTSQITTTDGFAKDYLDHYPYDPGKAKQLLAQAGQSRGLSLGALVYVGNPYVDGPQLAQAMAKYLAAVGVNLKVTTAATVAEFVEKRKSLRYPTIEATFLPGVPMWTTYVLGMSPQGAQNPFGAHYPELEGLWRQGSQSEDPERYWQELSRRTVTDADFLPVYMPKTFFYVNDKVGGVQMTAATPGYPYASEWFPK